MLDVVYSDIPKIEVWLFTTLPGPPLPPPPLFGKRPHFLQVIFSATFP